MSAMNQEVSTAEGAALSELDSATFDLDKWLAGVSRVTKFVEVYGKPHLQAEIDELDALAGDADESVRDDILTRADALRDEMTCSRARFKISSVPDERVEEIRSKVEGDEARTFAIMAEQIISPVGMTPEKLRAIRDGIGDGYFAQTITATCLAAQQGLAVTVPFSSAASRARKR